MENLVSPSLIFFGDFFLKVIFFTNKSEFESGLY